MGEGEESAVVAGLAFVADGESAVAEQPGDGAFDDPAVSAESIVGLDALTRDADADVAVAEPLAEVGDVVGLVGVEFGGSAAAGAAAGADCGDGRDQRFEHVGVVGVGCGHRHRQGNPATVGQHVDLRAGFASVDRVRAG